MAISSSFISDGTSTPDAPSADDEARVRSALLAGTSLDATLSAADNNYSRDLQQRGADLTRYLQRELNSPHASATYLDPNEYLALQARGGMSDNQVASTLLTRAHVAATPDNLKQVTDEMSTGVSTPYAGYVRTQDSHAIRDWYSPSPQADAIVPASAFFAPVAHIPGLTHEQNLEFIDRHEGWHTKDNQNLFIGIDPAKMASYNPEQNLRGTLGHPEQIRALPLNNRQESLADVGAAGDMIRNGADPSIIQNVIDWRHQDQEVSHMTAQSLRGLQQKINEMGIDKFRALNDDDARKLYEDIAVHNSLQPDQAKVAVRYITGTAQERAAIEQSTATDPNAAGALAYVKPYNLPPPRVDGVDRPTPPAPPRTPYDDMVSGKLQAYNSMDELRNRAFMDSGMITPMTLTQAYGAIQDNLRRGLDDQPNNALLQGEAQKLQQNFPATVQNTNYIAENARRGVDILKVAPELRGFSLQSANNASATIPAAPATTPAAPASPKGRAPAPST